MEGQIVRTIKDFLTTKDGELCVNQDEYLQVRLKKRSMKLLFKEKRQFHEKFDILSIILLISMHAYFIYDTGN